MNTARICEDPNARLVRNLRQQIEILEQRVQGTGDVRVSVEAVVSGSHAVGFSQQQRVTELEDEIERLKRRLSDTIRSNDTSWKEKVAEAEKKRIEAEQALSNYGLSNCMDQFQACLVNVNQVNLLDDLINKSLKLNFCPISIKKKGSFAVWNSILPPETRVELDWTYCLLGKPSRDPTKWTHD